MRVVLLQFVNLGYLLRHVAGFTGSFIVKELVQCGFQGYEDGIELLIEEPLCLYI